MILKDEKLEWELRAHIQQILCLLDDPDQIITENPGQAVDLCIRCDQLVNRVTNELNVARTGWKPVLDCLTDLLLEMSTKMNDYNLVVLHKRLLFFKDISETHYDDSARLSAKKIMAEISARIVLLAQE